MLKFGIYTTFYILGNKPTFECHPPVDKVINIIQDRIK